MIGTELFVSVALLLLCIITEFLEAFIEHPIVKIIKPIILGAAILIFPMILNFVFSMIDSKQVLDFILWIEETIAF